MILTNQISVELSELVQEAKKRLPLPSLIDREGLSKYAKASCCSPLREVNNPSWGIFQEDGLWYWKDHGTGDSGDEVTFIERLHGCTRADAMRRFCEMAGVDTRTTSKSKPSVKGRPNIPNFLEPTESDVAVLATLRNISTAAIQAALDAGILFFCRQSGFSSWGITDCTRKNAQLRRMDGKVWPEEWNGVGGKKAWTLKHSKASWPLGIEESVSYPNVALVEGGADLLAAYHVIHYEHKMDRVAPVSMLGAGLKIPARALPLFADKKVRIFGHADEQGQNAVKRWGHQLKEAGAEVDAYNFTGYRQLDGEPVVDLNDYCNSNASISYSECPWDEGIM